MPGMVGPKPLIGVVGMYGMEHWLKETVMASPMYRLIAGVVPEAFPAIAAD